MATYCFCGLTLNHGVCPTHGGNITKPEVDLRPDREGDVLPSRTAHDGEFLKVDGTNLAWAAASGPKGDKGDTGVTGSVGATGATGARGPIGPSEVGGFFSRYLFCDDDIGTAEGWTATPHWHELEAQADFGVVGAHTATGTSYTELDRYVTPALGTTVIPGGIWTFNLYAKVSAHTGQIRTTVYRVGSDGAVIDGNIGQVESVQFGNTVATVIPVSKYIAAKTGWDLTDRIGVILEGKRYTGTATLTFYHDASTGMVSSIDTPLTLLHNLLQGLDQGDYHHLTAAEYQALLALLA